VAASRSQHDPPTAFWRWWDQRASWWDQRALWPVGYRQRHSTSAELLNARDPSYRSWAVSSLTRRSQRLSFLIAFAQYPFDRLHDRHLKILLVAAIIHHLAHIFFERLQINHSIVAFGIIVAAEPRGDEPRLTDFVMQELVTVDFRTADK